ncbi:hypothetical protein ACJBCE_36515 [Streptomyces sp. NBUL23]|uniref:hypothetical protein n=1 Tax=Streptomyces sp. NBUL23 TaxID=3381354 RepID=UPI0038728574
MCGAGTVLVSHLRHAAALYLPLATTRKDPLTGLLRRDAYTTRARRLLATATTSRW